MLIHSQKRNVVAKILPTRKPMSSNLSRALFLAIILKSSYFYLENAFIRNRASKPFGSSALPNISYSYTCKLSHF